MSLQMERMLKSVEHDMVSINRASGASRAGKLLVLESSSQHLHITLY